MRLAVTPVDGSAPARSTEVAITDRFVLGLGESYAAGEGNPDAPQVYGERFDDAVQAYWSAGRAPNERWWRDPTVLAHLTPARWWDPVCHRSLYSPQVAAALLYAARRPHEAVTFASFACSGTEVLDGVLAPQVNPPGVSEFGAPARNFRMTPQIEAALELMCRNALAPGVRRANLSDLGRSIRLEREAQRNVERYPTALNADCADGNPVRRVDALLLSVGGNDVGFAGAVKYELLPTQANTPFGQVVLNKVREVLGVTPPWEANRKINYDLPLLYPALNTALREDLIGAVIPVIQASYPNPLRDQGGEFCDGPNDNQLFAAMHGMLPDEGIPPAGRWRFAITAGEGLEVEDALWKPLNDAVYANRVYPSWSVVDYGAAFARRGWCAGDLDERNAEYQFPGWRADGVRVSFDPRQWDAYAPRTRLFRTANDVVLTQVGSARPFYWPVGKFGNRSFYATSGMFHPAAEANTIVGIALSNELAMVLLPTQ